MANMKKTGGAGTKGKVHLHDSPMTIFVLITLAIFLVEGLIMVFINLVPGPEIVRTLVDPASAVILLSPILYALIIRPLIRQIRERIEAEELLKEERDRAQGYLDIAGVMIVVLDRKGRVELINKKGCEILGRNEAAILGKDWIDNFIPERMRHEVRLMRRSLFMEGAPFSGYYENPVLTSSGEERMILWTNAVLKRDGASTGTISSGEDITERKRAEADLQESETKYRQIHSTSFDAIIIADGSDRVLDCNPSACKMFGYTSSEMTGMEVKDLMPEEYRARHKEGLRRFVETSRSNIQGKVMEYEGLKKNGEVFPLELVLTSFNVGDRVLFNGTVRDMTEKRMAEREKDLIRSRLDQSQKMEAIGRFAGGISHDFNNILTAIRGNAEIAMEDIDKKSPAYERLEGIILSVMHASKLTRQLLLFSRKQTFELAPVNMNDVAGNLTAMLTTLLGDRITLDLDLYPDLWTTLADEGNMEQVIMNLTVNARDAMPQGGRLGITTRNVVIDDARSRMMPDARPGDAVCLIVSDTGMGMGPEVVQRIFEPFFSTKGPGKGTGFGLALVYGIVKQHEGWITVASELGKGTVFKIYLPAVPERRPAQKKARRAGGKGERVLLVQWDAEALESASRALLSYGYSVVPAQKAKDALADFESAEGTFDLVICDLALPDGGGLTLADKLRARKPGLPVLLTSSFMDMQSKRSQMEGRGYRYLQKPYSLSSLLMAASISLEHGGLKQ